MNESTCFNGKQTTQILAHVSIDFRFKFICRTTVCESLNVIARAIKSFSLGLPIDQFVKYSSAVLVVLKINKLSQVPRRVLARLLLALPFRTT